MSDERVREVGECGTVVGKKEDLQETSKKNLIVGTSWESMISCINV